MKRPAFQFYPSDWRNDPALRLCSMGARGLWIEAMCIMHAADPYGHLVAAGHALDHRALARLVGESPKAVAGWLQELADNGVSSVTDDGVLYSRRMVRDEDIRERRAAGGEAGKTYGKLGAKYGAKGGRPRNKTGDKKPPLEPPPSSSSSSSKDQKPAIGNSPPDSRLSGANLEKSGVELVAAATEANPALPAVVRLRKRGEQWLRLTPNNPEIIVAIREGVTVESIEAFAEAYPDKPPLYVIRAARREHAEGAQPIIGEPHENRSTSRKPSAVERVEAAIHERRARSAQSGPAGLPVGTDGGPLRQPLDVAGG